MNWRGGPCSATKLLTRTLVSRTALMGIGLAALQVVELGPCLFDQGIQFIGVELLAPSPDAGDDLLRRGLTTKNPDRD